MFQTGVGVSQHSDSSSAGHDACLKAISEIPSDPSFILVFSTIGYEKNDGFAKILESVSLLTKGKIPIIGGTTSGFMTNQGVFSHGVAVMAVFSPDSKITALYENNTKGNPKAVAEKVSEKILVNDDKNFKNKFLVEFISGPTIPRFPIINRLNFVKYKKIGYILTKAGMPITSMLGYGVAKDDIILTGIREKCQSYAIIGGSCIDDGKLFGNFQFFGKQVLTNSFVGLAIQTNDDVETDGSLHMEKTNTTFNVTATSENGTVIDKIDGRPAFEVFKEKLNLTALAFRDQHLLYRTTLFYPISTSENIESSTAIGAVYGDHILIGHKLISNKIELLNASGHRILDMSEKLKKILSQKSGMLYVSACETSCEAVGAKIYKQKEIIDSLRQSMPYLITYFGGEHYSKPNERINVRTHSFNVIAVG